MPSSGRRLSKREKVIRALRGERWYYCDRCKQHRWHRHVVGTSNNPEFEVLWCWTCVTPQWIPVNA